jgi:hypothetical protein
MDRNLLSVFRSAVLSVAVSSGFGVQTHAADTADTAIAVTNQPALSVDVHAKVEGSFMPYRYAFVTAGMAKYTFLVPDRYRVDSSDPAKVKLISPDNACFITVGVSTGGAISSINSSETLRAFANTNYSDVEFLADQTVCAGGMIAPGVDFNWKADADIIRRTRTAFFPTTTGLLEFTLTTSPEKFQAGLNEMNLVMLTFRTGINGRFDYVIGSNKP